MINRHYQYKCRKCGTNCGSDYNAFIGHPCSPRGPVEETGIPVRRVGMSDVVICDRGGEIFERRYAGGLIFWPNQKYRNNGDAEEKTLCPKCARELHEFLNVDNETRNAMEAFDPDAEAEAERIKQQETSARALESHIDETRVQEYDPEIG